MLCWSQVNCNDDQGVLLGRWDGSYADGISPMFWIGSVDILRRWKNSGFQKIKYGQCWVFAAVACTGELPRAVEGPEPFLGSMSPGSGVQRALEWESIGPKSRPISTTNTIGVLCGLGPVAAPLCSFPPTMRYGLRGQGAQHGLTVENIDFGTRHI